MFADLILAADHQPAGLALVFEVLRAVPNRGEGIDHRSVAHGGVAVDHHMGDEAHARAERDIGADHAIGPDFDGIGEFVPPGAITAVGWMLVIRFNCP